MQERINVKSTSLKTMFLVSGALFSFPARPRNKIILPVLKQSNVNYVIKLCADSRQVEPRQMRTTCSLNAAWTMVLQTTGTAPA